MEDWVLIKEKYNFALTKKGVSIELKEQILNFFEDEYQKEINGEDNLLKAYVYEIGELFAGLNFSDLNWNRMCEFIQKSKRASGAIRAIFGFFYEKDLIVDKHATYTKRNQWLFKSYLGVNSKNIFTKNTNPYGIYKLENSLGSSVFNFNTDNDFIIRLLIDFIDSSSEKEVKSTRFRVFISNFAYSLCSIDNEVTEINSLDYEVFKKQYRFFRKYPYRESNSRLLNILVKFYLYLIQGKGLTPSLLFNHNTGLDLNYLKRVNFHSLYRNGFKVVLLNRLDEMPSSDFWLVNPNGSENYSTVTKSYQYFSFDFNKIKEPYLKYCLKHWFWYSKDSFTFKEKYIYNIIIFLDYLNGIWSRNNKVVDIHSPSKKIDLKSISNFRFYTLNSYSPEYARFIVEGTKSFVKHCDNFELLEVNSNVYDYLKIVKNNPSEAKPIPEDDLKKIVLAFKENMNKGVKEKLFWIILNLKLTTNLRISEILNLKVNNLNKTKLLMQRKGSGSELEEVFLSDYAARNLHSAIELTNDLRQDGISKHKNNDYIFIMNSIKGRTSVMDRDLFFRNFKRICSNLDLKEEYTVYNLRHTYMTNIYDEGKKAGTSIFDIHLATGHKSMETTIKHYRNSDIKNYLEAMYNVRIGDTNVAGKINESTSDLTTNSEELKRITVRNSTGFCGAFSCISKKDIDCLLCPFFVTTLDRIPYFKEGIKSIEKELEEEMHPNEREELIQIKKIYVAYLNRLYEVKNKQVGGEKD